MCPLPSFLIRPTFLDGSTYGGSVQTSLGGVGRNISDAILRLGQQCLLITAVGNDRQGQLVRENNPNAMTGGIRVLEDLPTSACAVTIEGNGECILLVGDFRVHQRIDRDFVSTFERQLCAAPIVIMDGNIATATMDYVLDVCRRSRVPGK
ncbi:hypothetical protein TYRP_016685 [Tyrophagus putrescentiae]|nr:hypothetical protein TYRP_016685 [Tyrophagus putrescentiae]